MTRIQQVACCLGMLVFVVDARAERIIPRSNSVTEIPRILPAPEAPPRPQTRVAQQHHVTPTMHLKLALEHLRAAGAEDLAQVVSRQLSDRQNTLQAQIDEQQALIAEKQTHLAELQRELDAIQTAEDGPHVAFTCQLVEVDLDKLRELMPEESPTQVTSREEAFNALQGLKGHSHLLSEPRLLTHVGTPGEIFTGQEVQIPSADGSSEFRSVGTHLSLSPEALLKNGSLQLAVAIEQSWIKEQSQQIRTVAGETKLLPHQTLWIQMQDKNENKVLLLLVTPEFEEP